MFISSIRRCFILTLLCASLAACGDLPTGGQATVAPVAEQPTASRTAISATETVAATPSVLPATATTAPTKTATKVPPSATATTEPTVAPSATPTPRTAEATSTPVASEPPPAATETGVQAQYVFPVQGAKVNYGRAHHDYPAADIFCPVGSHFVAPTSGVVDYVTREDIWDPATDSAPDRGGKSVAIVGDDGVRYYGSHLSQVADGIEAGVRVEAGQLLGLTGNSGNARFTPSHLHFGISHPTTPDDWKVRRGEISPYDYLRAWQQGKQVRPKL